MSKTYYAILEAGSTEPTGLFYVDDDGVKLDLVGLNRLTGQFEVMPALIDFFVGQGSGDRAAEITEERAVKLARDWGVPSTS